MNRMQAVPLYADSGNSVEPTVASPTTMATFYESSVPSFVQQQLEALYESLYSTLAQFQLRSNPSLADVHTYLLYRDGSPSTILLFRVKGHVAYVLNEVISISGTDAERFAAFVFEKFQSVSAIAFHAVRPDLGQTAFRYHRFNVLEDIVLSLPDSEEQYLAALGKSTRKTIKYYSNKLKRDYPSFEYQTFTKESITREHVQSIIEMKAARMARKNKAALVSDEDIARILSLAKHYGVLGLATIDGKPCGGSMGYRVGKNEFMDLCAYDTAYEEYRLGTLCCYLAITDCIARGGKDCHFQWGRDEYKFRFLGAQQDLEDLIIYRSTMAMHLYGARFWKSAVMHLKRKIKAAIQHSRTIAPPAKPS